MSGIISDKTVERIENRISEFQIGWNVISSISKNKEKYEIIGIHKCLLNYHVYCEICRTKIKLKNIKYNKAWAWYCPVSKSGRMVFKIDVRPFLTEEEMIL